MKKKFGTFSGVFIPSFEAILGAVLFLILPMLTGAMGFWQMTLIIFLANTVTVATGFSIADCTTNLVKVGSGGMYAISRESLGKAFGGSIGIQLFFAQSASIGFYAIAFAEPVQDMVLYIPFINDLIGGFDILTQTQIIATCFVLIAFIVGLIGANFVTKIQFIIFIVLIISILSIALSPLFKGVKDITTPFTDSINFWGVPGVLFFWLAFVQFFPAVCGIDAGVGMSGSLKNPRKSLPKGTFIAISVTFFIYVGIAFVFSLINPQSLYTVSGSEVNKVSSVTVFSDMPIIPIILRIGIMVAAGSSGLAYFLTAPSTAQALVKENVLPRFLNLIGRDFTKKGTDPRWATVLTLFIILPVIWAGGVEEASTVVGICFLVVYGWVNLAAFMERVSGNPSFRPTSKGHWIISLYGFLICMVVISMFNIWIGIGVIISQLIIFNLILKFKTQNRLEGVWWGVLFSVLNWGFKRMHRIIQGTKNWRPIIGIFSFADKPEETYQTLDIGKKIADFKGLTMLNILKPEKLEKIPFTIPPEACQITVPDNEFNNTIVTMLQASAPGGMDMNTALLPLDERLNYVEIIESLIKLDKNVLLYCHGPVLEPVSNRIDVWWKGEANGNFMALLSYIIKSSDAGAGRPVKQIRLIRKLFKEEPEEKARREMSSLLDRARLEGEILILPEDDTPIHESIQTHSADAVLILMGMPGKKAPGLARLFALDKIFFTREIQKFKNLPPLLFVKAHQVFSLFE